MNDLTNKFEHQLKKQNLENEKKMNELKLVHQQSVKNLMDQLSEKEERLTNVSLDLNELKNEKKIQLNNEKESINEFEERSPEILSEFSENNKKLIYDKLLNLVLKFIDSENFFEDIKTKLIPKIIENENIKYNIIQFMNKKINSKKVNSDINNFNILIMGPTGVGKSTLINEILKQEVAKTGIGYAVTEGKPKAYESENRKGIRLYDTKGIETGKYGINEAKKDINETIKELLDKKNPDQFIHCIWYCFNGDRFIKEEEKILKVLNKSYCQNGLPVIIIHTKTFNKKRAEDIIDVIKEKCEIINGAEFQILKILAKEEINEGKIYHPFGINQLLMITCEKCKLGIQNSIIECLINDGKKELEIELKNSIDFLKEYISNIFNYNILKNDLSAMKFIN